ncbi:hypothetical protein HYU19_03895 [Candidatus Woesearchaeota archaeon]|nr:hypothetical protein [Candidatus Woesearchaeota archaeon]
MSRLLAGAVLGGLALVASPDFSTTSSLSSASSLEDLLRTAYAQAPPLPPSVAEQPSESPNSPKASAGPVPPPEISPTEIHYALAKPGDKLVAAFDYLDASSGSTHRVSILPDPRSGFTFLPGVPYTFTSAHGVFLDDKRIDIAALVPTMFIPSDQRKLKRTALLFSGQYQAVKVPYTVIPDGVQPILYLGDDIPRLMTGMEDSLPKLQQLDPFVQYDNNKDTRDRGHLAISRTLVLPDGTEVQETVPLPVQQSSAAGPPPPLALLPGVDYHITTSSHDPNLSAQYFFFGAGATPVYSSSSSGRIGTDPTLRLTLGQSGILSQAFYDSSIVRPDGLATRLQGAEMLIPVEAVQPALSPVLVERGGVSTSYHITSIHDGKVHLALPPVLQAFGSADLPEIPSRPFIDFRSWEPWVAAAVIVTAGVIAVGVPLSLSDTAPVQRVDYSRLNVDH